MLRLISFARVPPRCTVSINHSGNRLLVESRSYATKKKGSLYGNYMKEETEKFKDMNGALAQEEFKKSFLNIDKYLQDELKTPNMPLPSDVKGTNNKSLDQMLQDELGDDLGSILGQKPNQKQRDVDTVNRQRERLQQQEFRQKSLQAAMDISSCYSKDMVAERKALKAAEELKKQERRTQPKKVDREEEEASRIIQERVKKERESILGRVETKKILVPKQKKEAAGEFTEEFYQEMENMKVTHEDNRFDTKTIALSKMSTDRVYKKNRFNYSEIYTSSLAAKQATTSKADAKQAPIRPQSAFDVFSTHKHSIKDDPDDDPDKPDSPFSDPFPGDTAYNNRKSDKKAKAAKKARERAQGFKDPVAEEIPAEDDPLMKKFRSAEDEADLDYAEEMRREKERQVKRDQERKQSLGYDPFRPQSEPGAALSGFCSDDFIEKIKSNYIKQTGGVADTGLPSYHRTKVTKEEYSKMQPAERGYYRFFMDQESEEPEIPLTTIEKELLKLKKDKREAQLMDDVLYSDDEVFEDTNKSERRYLRQAAAKIDKELEETKVKNDDRVVTRDEYGDVYVGKELVPDELQQTIIDELNGVMNRRERRKLERRLQREKERVDRLRTSRKRSSKYQYDGDSQFTRRQLRMSELVCEQLRATLDLPFFRALQGLGITIEHVTINRELSIATIFWQTVSSDFDAAYEALENFKPDIRRLFAKRTSLLRVSPDLKFIRREAYEQLELAKDFDTKVHETKIRLTVDDEKVADELVDRLHNSRAELPRDARAALVKGGMLQVDEPTSLLEAARAQVEQYNYQFLAQQMEDQTLSDNVVIENLYTPHVDEEEVVEYGRLARDEYDDDCDESAVDLPKSQAKPKAAKTKQKPKKRVPARHRM